MGQVTMKKMKKKKKKTNTKEKRKGITRPRPDGWVIIRFLSLGVLSRNISRIGI